MAYVEGEIFIRRPPEEVFDFVADERNEPRYNPYLTNAEREAIVKRKEELRQLSVKTKRELLVDVDMATATVQEKKVVTSRTH